MRTLELTDARIDDYETICRALDDMGGMREPEIEACTGLSAERVDEAVRAAMGLGYLVRCPRSGEVLKRPGGLS